MLQQVHAAGGTLVVGSGMAASIKAPRPRQPGQGLFPTSGWPRLSGATIIAFFLRLPPLPALPVDFGALAAAPPQLR